MILLFLSTGGGLDLSCPGAGRSADRGAHRAATPARSTSLVRNAGPEDLTIAQVIDQRCRLAIYRSRPSATIPRLQHCHDPPTTIPGHMAKPTPSACSPPMPSPSISTSRCFRDARGGSTDLPEFHLDRAVCRCDPSLPGAVLVSGSAPAWPALDGLFAGVTAGLLVFLGLDTLAEALEQAAVVPGSFQGLGLVGIGAVGTFFLLDAISKRQVATGRSEAAQRLSLAYMIAIGIGLHNLGEGLAIGAALQCGRDRPRALPGGRLHHSKHHRRVGHHRARAARPARLCGSWLLMGLIGGAPAILGSWIGGFSPSPTLGCAVPGDRNGSGVRSGL